MKYIVYFGFIQNRWYAHILKWFLPGWQRSIEINEEPIFLQGKIAKKIDELEEE